MILFSAATLLCLGIPRTALAQNDPMKAEAFCIGFACDFIKCSSDVQCPPGHTCSGYAQGLLGLAPNPLLGGIGGPLGGGGLGIKNLIGDPMRTSGGIFGTGGAALSGFVDGALEALIPGLEGPGSRSFGKRYCRPTGLQQPPNVFTPGGYTVTGAVNANSYALNPLHTNGIIERDHLRQRGSPFLEPSRPDTLSLLSDSLNGITPVNVIPLSNNQVATVSQQHLQGTEQQQQSQEKNPSPLLVISPSGAFLNYKPNNTAGTKQHLELTAASQPSSSTVGSSLSRVSESPSVWVSDATSFGSDVKKSKRDEYVQLGKSMEQVLSLGGLRKESDVLKIDEEITRTAVNNYGGSMDINSAKRNPTLRRLQAASPPLIRILSDSNEVNVTAFGIDGFTDDAPNPPRTLQKEVSWLEGLPGGTDGLINETFNVLNSMSDLNIECQPSIRRAAVPQGVAVLDLRNNQLGSEGVSTELFHIEKIDVTNKATVAYNRLRHRLNASQQHGSEWWETGSEGWKRKNTMIYTVTELETFKPVMEDQAFFVCNQPGFFTLYFLINVFYTNATTIASNICPVHIACESDQSIDPSHIGFRFRNYRKTTTTTTTQSPPAINPGPSLPQRLSVKEAKELLLRAIENEVAMKTEYLLQKIGKAFGAPGGLESPNSVTQTTEDTVPEVGVEDRSGEVR